jgi:hypothetical protein
MTSEKKPIQTKGEISNREETPTPTKEETPYEKTVILENKESLSSPTPSKPIPTTVNPNDLNVADFDSCFEGRSDLDLPMGVAYTDTLGTVVKLSMISDHDPDSYGDCSAQIDFTIYDWGGVWFNLGGANLSNYNIVAFDIRSGESEYYPSSVKVELKRDCEKINDVSVCNQGIAKIHFFEEKTEWTRVQMHLEHFGPDGVHDEQITSFDDVDQLVLVITNPNQETVPITGSVIIDNIGFHKQTLNSNFEIDGLTAANFDSCMHVNNLGGSMGKATYPKDKLLSSFWVDEDGGCALLLEYHMSDWERSWVAYWIKLNQAELNDYDNLAFDIKAEPHGPVNYVQGIKIELIGGCYDSNWQCRSIYYLPDEISSDWINILIPIEHFQSPGWALGIEKGKIEEVVFTFENRYVGSSDIIYIDNVHFR